MQTIQKQKKTNKNNPQITTHEAKSKTKNTAQQTKTKGTNTEKSITQTHTTQN